MIEPVKISGLIELQAALKRMDADMPKQLRVVLNEAATIIINYAAPRFPRKTGRAATSLTARSSQRESRVALGGRKAPYAPGLDFGGGRPQFPPYQRGGRYVYAGLDANRAEIQALLDRALARLAADAAVELG